MSLLQRIPFRPTRSQTMRFLLSLLIATLLWGWVTQRNDPYATDVYREMDVSIGQLPDSLEVVTTLPRAVVTLRGPRSELDGIERGNITVRLDTSPVSGPGEYRLKLRATTPSGPNEKSVEPSEVPVTVEEHVSKEMPLEWIPSLPDDDRRQLVDVRPEVSQVTISGPSSAVNRVERVLLPITADNQTTDFRTTFIPYAVDANGQRVSEVEVLPGQISTSVDIQSRGKTVSVIPEFTGTPAEGYSVQQRTVLPDTVIVDGPAEVLETLLFVNTEPVDISGTTESISRRVGLTNLPEGVTVIEPSSATVEVRIAIEDISTTAQTLSSLPIQPLGLEAGLSAEFSPPTIDVTVDGPVNVLTQMKSSDVKIRVDLTGLGPGEHDVQPEITVPQGITWIGNEPATVRVTITEGPSEPDASPASSPVALAPHNAQDRSERRRWHTQNRHTSAV